MEAKKQLLETNWFHSGNLIWVYDATGMGWKNKTAIANKISLQVTKIAPNQKFQLINKCEKIAILLPNNEQCNVQKTKDSVRIKNSITLISEEDLRVTEQDLERPAAAITLLEGIIEDVSRVYNPRFFSLTLAALDASNAALNSLALYKNVAAIKRPQAGSVNGNFRLSSGAHLAWVLLELKILITGKPDLVFKAQANQHGDFIIPLAEFPALEKDSLDIIFTAKLTVKACALVNKIPNVELVSALKIESFSDKGTFVDEVSFSIAPGQHMRLSSADGKSVVVTL